MKLHYLTILLVLASAIPISAQFVTLPITLCQGEPFNGQYYLSDTAVWTSVKTSGIPDTLFVIEVIPTVETQQTHHICQGELLLGQFFTKDTLFSRLYTAQQTGCDSLVWHHVFLKNAAELPIQGQTAFCKGDTVALSVGFFSHYEWSTGINTRSINVWESGRYAVTVTDQTGCTNASFVDVLASDLEVEIEKIPPTCSGRSDGIIDAYASGGAAPYTFHLNTPTNANTNGFFENLEGGFYTLTVRDGIGCVAKDTLFLETIDPIKVSLPEEISVFVHEQIQVHAITSKPATEIRWSPPRGLSCHNCLDPILELKDDQTFVVTATDENGCTDSDTLLVLVDNERRVYIPNVFVADPERYEGFEIFTGEGVASINRFAIFDRNGGQVLEVREKEPGDPALYWDGQLRGKPMPQGTYVYVVEVLFEDGLQKIYSDDVLLIR